MFGKSLALVLAVGLLAPAPALADSPDPTTGKIAGYTYGADAYNSYVSWGGSSMQFWWFSAQHLGVAPGAQAGTPFYLHAHTAVLAPHSVTGNVLITIDQDAGGLPLRVAPTASMPLVCSLAQFDPVVATSSVPCRASVTLESGQYVVTNLEPLVPGFAFDVLVPVVVDTAATGNAAMTAMWATTDVTLSTNNVMASVPVTVGAAPPPVTRSLPKGLRKYKKVKSLTPAVCTMSGRTVLKVGSGTCSLKGTKRPRHRPKVVSFTW